MKRLEARIEGHVQGVGFRANTQRQARSLNITGWVRNNRDGSVSVVAEGSKSDLKELEHFLNEGPRAASVDSIDISYGDAANEFDGFNVRR